VTPKNPTTGPSPGDDAEDVLSLFSAPIQAWTREAFAAPTPAQEGAWRAIHGGRSAVLVVAPTGSGKTLAAFLWSLDRIASAPPPPHKFRLRVLYVSPLKALAADVERNLRAPLIGIRNAAARLGLPPADIAVHLRTGDTPADERRRFAAHPPDILITTPESLFLILTSQAREALRFVDTVIVDEIHALAPTKRGAHLALSLARLDALLPAPARRIGLSATVRPLDEVARFLSGGEGAVETVQPAAEKRLELEVVVPLEDMAEGAVGSRTQAPLSRPVAAVGKADDSPRTIWPAIEERLVELIRAHRSTIVFANSRRLAERLCARLNDAAGDEIARAHHGSVSREQRLAIEDALKSGRLPAVVATSSLELGIDMAAVDLVVQVEAPPTVASGLQRIGRAGHQVGATSRGVLLPKWRGDLLECTVVVERMRAGDIEPLRCPRNPLDVLAQQVVAMAAMDEWAVDDLAALVRRTWSFSQLPQSALDGVLDMLSGLYPSDEFAELRPRITWNRVSGRIQGRPGAQRLAVTSGGTIPDRGLFGVYLAGDGKGGRRVGELDEEMVYESRRGEVFLLGSSSWRIEEITHDRVMVTPAPGQPGKLPFWHGDTIGRPIELGRAHGRFLREVVGAPREEAEGRLRAAGLDEAAADNLLRYLVEQKEATGALPDDRTIVLERFVDELGDWRLCIHSPFGARIHAPWAMAIAARVRERLGVEVQSIHTDDGIVVRLPEADQTLPIEHVVFDPDEIEPLVTAEVGASAMFASRFRECAARALLLPRRRPGSRTPLWQQRQRSANLLAVAAGYGSFPIILETMRECLQDVFDLPALRGLMSDIRSRAVKVVQVQTDRASPFATALLFGYIGAFIYDGDAPLAERRAQVLTLDTALLAELLGQAELREIIDGDALVELERALQRLSPERRVRSVDDAHDALRVLGDLSEAELAARGGEPSWLATLETAHRAVPVHLLGERRWIAIEDAGRYRDALGVVLPPGIPSVFLASPRDPLADLVARYARTHGPFQPQEAAARYALGVAVVGDALARLETAGRVVRGEFRPGGHGLEWCDVEVLRALRRRSLARLRREVEAVPMVRLARFLPAWHGVGARRRSPDLVLRVVEQLQGAAIPASALETLVLPARVEGYGPWMLDELCAGGDVVWVGAGPIGADDGWIRLYLAEDVELLRPREPAREAAGLLQAREEGASAPLGLQVLEAMESGGALFFRQIVEAVSRAGGEAPVSDGRMLEALWELVWAGAVTNDTLAPLRVLLGGTMRTDSRRAARRPRRGPSIPSRLGPPAGAGRWSRTPRAAGDATRRQTVLAEQLLDRHGILTRGAVQAEDVSGGFGGIYDVLAAFEDAGRCRRGYFVEGLGAAQFAVPGAVDRLRAEADEGAVVVLAATDPANAYGAALPWPGTGDQAAHRPGRKAGAMVVLREGALVAYVERGGKTLLTFTDEPDALSAGVEALAEVVRRGHIARISVERANGESVFGTPLALAMTRAGFRETHRGLVLTSVRHA
jgi:ATP-dependent Lhr-like helicase